MPGNLYVTNAVAQDMLQAIKDAIDAGTGAPIIEIYEGTQPSDADATPSGETLLATLTMSDPAFGSISDDDPGAIMTANSITDDTSADNSGTAEWFQMLTESGGTVLLRGNVGTNDEDLAFGTVSFTAGSTISITSMTIKQPES